MTTAATSIRILILEDNESDYELVKRELRKGGFEVVWDWVKGREDFLLALEGPAPAVILLDYSLPGFDGMNALVLAHQHFPDVPAIIVSGGIGEDVAIETLKSGATDYVLKQRLERLTPVISRALRGSEQLNEKRRAEEALSASRKRFKGLFSSSNEGIGLHEVVYSENGKACDYRILTVNPAFERITGIAKERAEGTLATDLYGLGVPPYLEIYANVAATGEPTAFDTYFSPMGKYFRISAFSPEAGQFATMFVDITERKGLETQLKRRAEELARSNEELQQFAYIASHDLQEPLRMVTSYLSLLERKYGDKLDDRGKEYLRFAAEGGVRARELIHDLLEYSRAGSKGKPLRTTDMEAVLNKVCHNLRVQIQEEGATILRGPLPRILADDNQMAALFQNLISNAIKFHGAEPPTVSIKCDEDGGWWVFSIRDNGIGIDPQFSDQIFQIFQRLHTSSDYPGTGIGLAIAKKIVERHGGRIWLESAIGKGSTFYFTIPNEQYDDLTPSP
jgi:signal transduction histidine kinase